MKIRLEVISRAPACVSSQYMIETVQQASGPFAGSIDIFHIDLNTDKGKSRFLELSISLNGEEAVRVHHRLAPVPSLFCNDRLIADTIPPVEELIQIIEKELNIRP